MKSFKSRCRSLRRSQPQKSSTGFKSGDCLGIFHRVTFALRWAALAAGDVKNRSVSQTTCQGPAGLVGFSEARASRNFPWFTAVAHSSDVSFLHLWNTTGAKPPGETPPHKATARFKGICFPYTASPASDGLAASLGLRHMCVSPRRQWFLRSAGDVGGIPKMTPSIAKDKRSCNCCRLNDTTWLAKASRACLSTREYSLYCRLGSHRYPAACKTFRMAGVLTVTPLSRAISCCSNVDVQMQVRRSFNIRLITNFRRAGVTFQGFLPQFLYLYETRALGLANRLCTFRTVCRDGR